MHPWAGTFPWHWSQGRGRACQGHQGTRSRWVRDVPLWALLPMCLLPATPDPANTTMGSSRLGRHLQAPAPTRDADVPPSGFGAHHFSWIAFVPRPCSPQGAPGFFGGLHGPDCTLSHHAQAPHQHNLRLGDRPVTQSIAILDIGTPLPDATHKERAPGGPPGFPRGRTDGLIRSPLPGACKL